MSQHEAIELQGFSDYSSYSFGGGYGGYSGGYGGYYNSYSYYDGYGYYSYYTGGNFSGGSLIGTVVAGIFFCAIFFMVVVLSRRRRRQQMNGFAVPQVVLSSQQSAPAPAIAMPIYTQGQIGHVQQQQYGQQTQQYGQATQQMYGVPAPAQTGSYPAPPGAGSYPPPPRALIRTLLLLQEVRTLPQEEERPLPTPRLMGSQPPTDRNYPAPPVGQADVNLHMGN